jgi:hypothetical protein
LEKQKEEEEKVENAIKDLENKDPLSEEEKRKLKKLREEKKKLEEVVSS